MEEETSWDRLVEPLRRRGILVRQTSGQFHWYPDGGAAAQQGPLWFIFGSAAGTSQLQCWVADRDDDSNRTICTLANLLVTIGKGVLQSRIGGAARRSEHTMMEAYAEVIVQCFGHFHDDLQKWRDTVAFEEDMAPHVERMFEKK